MLVKDPSAISSVVVVVVGMLLEDRRSFSAECSLLSVLRQLLLLKEK